jgi:hypothetical protein
MPARDFKPVVKLFTPDAQCTWLPFFVWPGCSRVHAFARHRRVRRASPTRLSDFRARRPQFRCRFHAAISTPTTSPSAFAILACELELGYVSLNELRTARGKLGLPVERDLHLKADKRISAYADEARTRGHIVT